MPPGLLGGVSSALSVTAPAVIKAAPGICVSVVIVVVGSGGTLTLNDCTATGVAAAANQFFNIAYTALAAGMTLVMNWPCLSGIVVSAVPTSAQIVIAYS